MGHAVRAARAGATVLVFGLAAGCQSADKHTTPTLPARPQTPPREEARQPADAPHRRPRPRLGRTLARPGVTALYPGYPQSAAPGFKLAVDTTKLSNGVHSLQVIVSDTLGSDTLLGEVRSRQLVLRPARPGAQRRVRDAPRTAAARDR